MAGACHDSVVLRPFVAYLRVYEPVSAFGSELAGQLREAIAASRVTRANAGEREQLLWLRSQMAVPARMLPAELPDGSAAPSGLREVLVLRTADIPPAGKTSEGDSVVVGPGPLVCPLEIRARSAAALVNFLGTAHPVLRAASISPPVEEIRAHASAALADVAGAAVHVLSSAYSVPLPWFTLIDPAQRQVLLGERNDPERQVVYRTSMGQARQRVEHARQLAVDSFGEQGPAKLLSDTREWLGRFHPHSAVELDYGGLVQVMSDEMLAEDSSAADVHGIVTALESGDAEEVAERFERLRDFWSELASRERIN
ncbi:hypothetical protein EV191_103387 [Tamaricihabitans halophyticus]|uniref:DUF8083 domain-containing protein n=1 Tax=Tamaricihabitans halophyticus TaxID=1262583 RepID=A0A4R2QW56_9PSEU|nr:hypothetical protein EV191_103387 [Tamaricihabitans halophyticus]